VNFAPGCLNSSRARRSSTRRPLPSRRWSTRIAIAWMAPSRDLYVCAGLNSYALNIFV